MSPIYKKSQISIRTYTMEPQKKRIYRIKEMIASTRVPFIGLPTIQTTIKGLYVYTTSCLHHHSVLSYLAFSEYACHIKHGKAEPNLAPPPYSSPTAILK